MTKQSELQLKNGNKSMKIKTIAEENAARLPVLKKYLETEMQSKQPCQAYIDDLQLSIDRIELPLSSAV
jgi:hypothetical protein